MVVILRFLSSTTGIVCMVVLAGWLYFNHAVNQKLDEKIKEANDERHAVVQTYENKIWELDVKQQKDVIIAFEKGQKEMKEKLDGIPKKVTKVADTQCTITLGFLQSYASAFNLPVVPLPSGKSVDSPSGIPISSVARSDILNGNTALNYKTEVVAWREWFTRNKTEHDKYCKESKSCNQPANEIKR